MPFRLGGGSTLLFFPLEARRRRRFARASVRLAPVEPELVEPELVTETVS